MKICFHNWLAWSKLVPSYNGHKTQFRECKNCGKIQFRDLGYCDGTNADEANKALSEVKESFSQKLLKALAK